MPARATLFPWGLVLWGLLFPCFIQDNLKRKEDILKKVDRKRYKQIIFRTTPEEKAQLLKNMEAAGYSTLASYLLRMGLNGYVVNINFSEMKSTLAELGAVRSELNKIGNNINQVAKHVNQSHEIDAMDFYLLEEEMKAMRKQMEKVEKQIITEFNKKLKALEEN